MYLLCTADDQNCTLHYCTAVLGCTVVYSVVVVAVVCTCCTQLLLCETVGGRNYCRAWGGVDVHAVGENENWGSNLGKLEGSFHWMIWADLMILGEERMKRLRPWKGRNSPLLEGCHVTREQGDVEGLVEGDEECYGQGNSQGHPGLNERNEKQLLKNTKAADDRMLQHDPAADRLRWSVVSLMALRQGIQ